MATTASSRGSEPISKRPVGPPPLALRLAAVLAVPVLLYALVATGQKALENYRLNQQADALRLEVRAFRDENVRLQQEIVEAHTDVAIEAIAREQLGLVKPGDNAVVLVPAKGPAAAAEAVPATASVLPPPWQQWWNAFFGLKPSG